MFSIIIGALAFAAVSLSHVQLATPAKDPRNFIKIVLMVYALVIIASLFIFPFFNARLQNIIWNHTNLGPHRFASTLTARGLTWIVVTNLIGIILTLGLFKPFADIRMARYRAEHMAMLPAGDVEAFMAGERQAVGAAGSEAAEMFDVDIAL